ncbi:2-C-methyl-D-erythritol 4-phosphate cytidylyltransferase [Proteiniborus sp. DW1]|uniref:2-C-methyl-D-erythritol 4-phosphate cytidylyltransferase n=1 Tax=Proteiniborus sp. DW1 TaxID=1889883 RepID=UPI00092DEDF0|nr:2-C-methyl-D-erythritol 4-phosphate cytidylyltransferase [Proteiniborus sp. DW1]SCG84133.1 2-C-methyl-D-erythritol 4-phosphate cytidylyltransferase [Proteiniborus sp. DW1]
MSYNGKYISVVLPASGIGKRMNSSINKQFILLKDKPILAYTIEKFDNNEYIDEIVVVAREEEKEYCFNEVVKKYGFRKVTNIVGGGTERQDSVYKGLLAVNGSCDIVLIHDGVRPFVRDEDIINSIKGVIKHKACVIGTPVKDTIKKVNVEGDIIDTPERSTLWAVQTPQSFSYDIILKAYDYAIKSKIIGTDDSMLVEKLGYKVKIIEGSYSNIKITTPEDLKLAQLLLS